MHPSTEQVQPNPTVTRYPTPEASRGYSVPKTAARWVTTGEIADELVTLSRSTRSATDAAGDLHLFALARQMLISCRRDLAEREIARLENWRKAEDGWDGYRAVPARAVTLDLASELLRQFADLGLPIPLSTMSPAGNAALFIHDRGVYLDVEFHEDNTVSWLIQLPSGPEIECSEAYDGQSRGLRLVEILKYAPGAVP